MTPPPLSHATTPRSAARRGAITLGVGGVAALGFGAMVSAFPVALVAVFAVPAVILFPLMGVGIAVLSDGVAFPALITGFSTTLINIGVLGAVIAALPVALIRRRANTIVIKIAAALAATSITGMVIALIAFPTSQWLSGARYFLVPIAVAVLASALNDRQLRVLLRAVAALMAASFAAAIVETALGSDRLLELTGLEYGTSIRNFGTALRAPGTFATNYHLGAFSSVIAVVALLWWSSLQGARKDIIWRIVALISAVGCLALSTYRTGVVVLIVSVVAAVFLSGDAVKRWVKISVAVTGIAVGVGFFAVGLGDSKSFFQRLDIWAQLLGNDSALLGHGIGYAGAASGAAGSAVQIFTDNYYISLWLQFGIPAIASIGILIAVLVMLFREGKSGNSRAALAASLWAGLLVAFFLVEFWEYTSSMCLVAVVIGASARGYVRSRPDGQHIVAHTAPLDLSQPVMTAPTRSQK